MSRPRKIKLSRDKPTGIRLAKAEHIEEKPLETALITPDNLLRLNHYDPGGYRVMYVSKGKATTKKPVSVPKEEASEEILKKRETVGKLIDTVPNLVSHLYPNPEAHVKKIIPPTPIKKEKHPNSLVAQEEARVRLEEVRKQMENKVPVQIIHITPPLIIPPTDPEPVTIEYSCELCLKSVKEDEVVRAECSETLTPSGYRIGKCKSYFHLSCWYNVIYEDVAKCPKESCGSYIEICQYKGITKQMKVPVLTQETIEELDYELLNEIVEEEEKIEKEEALIKSITIPKVESITIPKVEYDSTPYFVEEMSKFDSSGIQGVQSAQQRRIIKDREKHRLKQIEKSSKYNTAIVNGIVCNIEVRASQPSPSQIFSSLAGITEPNKHSLPVETSIQPMILFNMDNLPPPKEDLPPLTPPPLSITSTPFTPSIIPFIPFLPHEAETSVKCDNISELHRVPAIASDIKKRPKQRKEVVPPPHLSPTQ